MSSERPPRFDDTDRPMTQYAGFSSSSKMASAKPVDLQDPFRNIPRLFPRDPHMPRNISEAERIRADRDTEPTGPSDESDNTPAQRPFEIRVEQRLDRVEKRLTKLEGDIEIIKKSSQDMAQLTLETHELVKKIDRHQRELEFERKWVPYAAYLVTTVIAIAALIRTFH